MTDLKSIEERANPYDNDVKELIAIAKWAKEARGLLEWLSPCGQGKYEHPTYDLIGKKVRDCLSRFPVKEGE